MNNLKTYKITLVAEFLEEAKSKEDAIYKARLRCGCDLPAFRIEAEEEEDAL